MKRLLLDTDILINWLRGEKWEKALLLTPGIDFHTSTVSKKELFQYKTISRREKRKINYLLNCFREIHVTPAIAQKASDLLNRHKHQGLKPADALIAATAWDWDLILISKNVKHFSFIQEISLNRL